MQTFAINCDPKPVPWLADVAIARCAGCPVPIESNICGQLPPVLLFYSCYGCNACIRGLNSIEFPF